MKLSEYIEKYGDCEVTDEIDKCIVKIPKTVYDLTYGDSYFFLSVSGTVQRGIWGNDSIDFNRRRIGNTFLTGEDAEFAKERLKVIAELKKYAKEFSDEEWKKGICEKCYIKFNWAINEVVIHYAFVIKGGEIYFETEEKVKKAIEAVGEDRVKKYYLGVKE